jgi:GNAT superfamily N-acetyltransferase
VAVIQAPRVPLADLSYRPATEDDLLTCAAIWRTSINDYTSRLNQPDIPDDLAAILRLYAHIRETDPDGFVVAERGGRADEASEAGGAQIVGFVSALRRGRLWFLSMLFVLPEMQGGGLGRALLDRVLPPAGTATLATCTDSTQPISNALYASLGIAPRLPLLRYVGLPDRPGALPRLPDGVRAVGFDEIGGGGVDRLGGAALDDELAALDLEVLGYGVEHGQDHDMARNERRLGFLYLAPDGEPIGYGYASEAGRVGPIAVRDAALLDPVIGHLVTTIRPRGAFGIWLPGAAETAATSLLRAGFRIDGFPCLICWDRPLVDFARYVPISPGLF